VLTLNGTKRLKEFMERKSTALVFAYYTCETACPLTVSNVQKASKSDFADYRFVVLSFDERDNLETLKAFIDKHFGGKVPENWLMGLWECPWLCLPLLWVCIIKPRRRC
jgi:protein SCO1/2